MHYIFAYTADSKPNPASMGSAFFVAFFPALHYIAPI